MSANAQPDLSPHDEIASLSPEALVHARHRWVAAAYEKLPQLTKTEREAARDRMLAAECSMWRVRFREAEKEAVHQKFRAEQAEARVKHLMERVEYLIELSSAPPESTDGATSTG